MPKATNKTKGSETNEFKFSIDKTIPNDQVLHTQGQDRGIPVDAFKYDDENFIVRTSLRKSEVNKSGL